MTMIGADPANALEMQGLTRLKATARVNEREGLREASRQFEALFLNEMLKSMRAATPKSGMFDDSATQLYTSMLDSQLAQNMAGKGIGIAEMIERDMLSKGMIDGGQGEYQEALIAGIPVARPRRLTNLYSDHHDAMAARQNPFAVEPQREARPAHVQRFVNEMGPAAKVASDASGIPAELILAQAALETGWGRKPIKTDAGANSFNMFGIKAGEHWKGRTTRVATTEYVDGKAVSQAEPFRVYSSVQESFLDYARLVGKSPRYASVVNAVTPSQAAYELQYSGYATDPEYGNKLVSVMDMIGPLNGKKTVAQVDEALLRSIW